MSIDPGSISIARNNAKKHTRVNRLGIGEIETRREHLLDSTKENFVLIIIMLSFIACF